jgi:hypothetical protein
MLHASHQRSTGNEAGPGRGRSGWAAAAGGPGAAAVYALVELVTQWDSFRDRNLIASDFWLITMCTLCLLADVFTIGVRRHWGAWPLVGFLAGAAAIGAASYLAAGAVWTTALAAWVYAGDLLVFGPCRCRSPWRSPRVPRDASSTPSRGWWRGCVAEPMRRRGAASWAWTCSIGGRCRRPAATMKRANEEKR